MARLSVNVNKIATLRNTRSLQIPDIVRLSAIALEAGADGITVHPRPDERHIRPADVDALGELLKQYPAAEYNIEGNPFHGLIDHCRRIKPTQATLVPDHREAFTSNSGWDLLNMTTDDLAKLKGAIAELSSLGCRVSLFMDPIPNAMPIACELGADRIELYTEPYARDFAAGHHDSGVVAYAATADVAEQLGMGVNAGHDLNLRNLGLLLQAVPQIEEVSIGHALIADALEFGMGEAVRRYHTLCNSM